MSVDPVSLFGRVGPMRFFALEVYLAAVDGATFSSAGRALSLDATTIFRTMAQIETSLGYVVYQQVNNRIEGDASFTVLAWSFHSSFYNLNSLAGRVDHDRAPISKIRVADAIIVTMLEEKLNRKVVADLLGIDAPTISRALKKLEVALCGELLTGAGSSSQFTDFGKVACIELNKIIRGLCSFSAPTKIITFSKYAEREELLIRCDASKSRINKYMYRMALEIPCQFTFALRSGKFVEKSDPVEAIAKLNECLHMLAKLKRDIASNRIDSYKANKLIRSIEAIKM